MPEYKNSEMMKIIEEYIHHPRYRTILRLRFCESLTYEEIAEKVNFSTRHVRHICKKYKPVLIANL